MDVSFDIIRNIANPNPVTKKKCIPSFCGGLNQDVFLKSAEQIKKSGVDLQQLREAIPEYLYHLTNNRAYESVQKDGILRASKDMIDGVYMFDLNDFIKNWTKPCGKNNLNISQVIFKQVIKSGNGFVLLKVPTKNLDLKKIIIRLEDEVLDFVGSDHYSNLAMVYAEKGGILKYKEELPKYMTKGYSPTKAPKYFSQGRPVEYIYKNDIPLISSGVIKVGEVRCNPKGLYYTPPEEFSSMLDNLIFSQVK